jgi:hypothetical protein
MFEILYQIGVTNSYRLSEKLVEAFFALELKGARFNGSLSIPNDSGNTV